MKLFTALQGIELTLIGVAFGIIVNIIFVNVLSNSDSKFSKVILDFIYSIELVDEDE